MPDSGGVVIVPAFTGLGAPYWDMYARGTILGLTRGSTRAHVARAALEGIAQRCADVTEAMAAFCGSAPALLAAENAQVTDTRYDDGVTVQFTLEAERQGTLQAALTERSAGQLTLTARGEVFAPFPVSAEE